MADKKGSSSNPDLSMLFQELEQWEAVLKSEPEVIHRLQEFEAAATTLDVVSIEKPFKKAPGRTRGPSL